MNTRATLSLSSTGLRTKISEIQAQLASANCVGFAKKAFQALA